MSSTTGADQAPAAPARVVFTPGYKRIFISLLVTAYTLNFIDRTIIATIGQAIKVDLKISDAQLGLLGGLYFALLYTFLGIPLARLAERTSRVNIISGAVLIWSAFTALCGIASSFLWLSVFRFGVGVGEAGLSPPAHSLISDYYEPRRRASALAVYSFGIPLGTMLGAVLGGWLAQNFSWRAAFLIVGVPGAIVALLVKLLVREPPRGNSEPLQETPAAPLVRRGEVSEILAVCRTLFGSWSVFNVVMGVTLVSFAGYGAGQFAPPYFIRAFHLNYAQVGLIIGLVGGLSQGLGTLAGGFLTDRLGRSHARWYALVPAIGVVVAFPFVVTVYNAPSWPKAAFFLLFPGLFAYTYLGPSFGIVQNMVESRRRATAAAILLFFLNLIALGGGPPFTGWIIDQFAAVHFAHPEAPGFFSTVAGALHGGSEPFRIVCPGGAAPPGAGPAAVQKCSRSLVMATRQGVVLASAFLLWGGLHYFLASFGLDGALRRARVERGEPEA